MGESLRVLGHLSHPKAVPETGLFEPATARLAFDALPTQTRIRIDNELRERRLTVWNSLARPLIQLLSLHVSTFRVAVSTLKRLPAAFTSLSGTKTTHLLRKSYPSSFQVYDLDGTRVKSEVFPVFLEQTSVSPNRFELTFVASLGPLSSKVYLLRLNEDET
jgi:hypothetical protein